MLDNHYFSNKGRLGSAMCNWFQWMLIASLPAKYTCSGDALTRCRTEIPTSVKWNAAPYVLRFKLDTAATSYRKVRTCAYGEP